MRVLVVLGLLAAAVLGPVSVASAPTNSVSQLLPVSEKQYQQEFVAFVRKYKKNYVADEFFARYNTFKLSYDYVREFTLQSDRTSSVSVNAFADMSRSEFRSKMTGFNAVDRSVLRAANGDGPHLNVTAPLAAVDWRAKHAVTGVKNQQQCGSCWAFSTTGSIEGAHAIKTGKLVSLSEQQLIDCSTAQGNQGCGGGLMDDAFQYVISNKGLTLEDTYPYTAAQGSCQTGVAPAATVQSFVDVAAGNEKDLLSAVNIGPVSVAIEADQLAFQLYSGGVLTDKSCGTQLDHGVLVVGYGTDAATGTDYWTVKNSWGASWGESGYIRIARGSNLCGIASSASYPVV